METTSGASGRIGARLAQFPRLREIQFSNTGFSRDDMVALARSKSLESFSCSGVNIPIAPLASLPSLRRLGVSIGIGDAQLSAFHAHRGLRELHLGGGYRADSPIPPVTEATLLSLSALPQFEELNSEMPLTSATLERLGSTGSLRRVWWHNFTIDDAGLSLLARSRGMRELGIDARNVTDSGMAALGHMRALESLWIRNCPANLAPLAGMKSLRYLSLQCRAGADSLEALAGLSSLTVLSIRAENFSDEDLAHLARLKNLRSISITSNRLTGEGLIHLRRLAALGKVSLHSPELSNKAAAHIWRLPSVKSVELGGGSITDAALPDLKGLSNPMEIHITSNNFSAAARDELAKTFPACQVNGASRPEPLMTWTPNPK